MANFSKGYEASYTSSNVAEIRKSLKALGVDVTINHTVKCAIYATSVNDRSQGFRAYEISYRINDGDNRMTQETALSASHAKVMFLSDLLRREEQKSAAAAAASENRKQLLVKYEVAKHLAEEQAELLRKMEAEVEAQRVKTAEYKTLAERAFLAALEAKSSITPGRASRPAFTFGKR